MRGIFLLFLVFHFCLGYSQDPLRFSLSGHVSECNSKKPLPNATVKLVGSDNTSFEIRTDSKGNYFFSDGYVNANTSYVVSASGLDIKTSDFPDGVLGNPKQKFTTVGIFTSTEFKQDFCLQKIQPCRMGPLPVVFKRNSSEFLNSSMLDSVDFTYRLLRENSNITIKIIGHASSAEKNPKQLALERAKVYKNQLIKSGIEEERLKIEGLVTDVEDKESYNNYIFKESTPFEQYQTRVICSIDSKTYQSKTPAKSAPQIKTVNSQSEGGEWDPYPEKKKER